MLEVSRELGIDLPPVAQALVAERAAAIRADAEERAANAERIAAREIAGRIVAERVRLEDPDRTRTMTMLRELGRRFDAPWGTLEDAGRMQALFARRTEGPVVDGRVTTALDTLPDGAELVFPAGRFELPVRTLRHAERFPRDLVIRGAGMDATVLVLDADWQARDEVHNLTLADLTIHTNDEYLESLREEPYMLRLERCRVIGFDMGAGGSCMLGGGTGLLYASDCRFEAGFGRSPGSGNLFDVRGGFAARLERCTFVGPFRSVYYEWPGAAQLFVDCAFEGVRDPVAEGAPGTAQDGPSHGDVVRFEDCTFVPPAPDAAARPARRSLTEINRDWGL